MCGAVFVDLSPRGHSFEKQLTCVVGGVEKAEGMDPTDGATPCVNKGG